MSLRLQISYRSRQLIPNWPGDGEGYLFSLSTFNVFYRHPDKNKSPEAVDKMARINWAYKVSFCDYYYYWQLVNICLNIIIIFKQNTLVLFVFEYFKYFSVTLPVSKISLSLPQILHNDDKRRRYDILGEESEDFLPTSKPDTRNYLTPTDTVSSMQFMNLLKPHSKTRPYLVYYFHDFCPACLSWTEKWEELRTVMQNND